MLTCEPAGRNAARATPSDDHEVEKIVGILRCIPGNLCHPPSPSSKVSK
jgi:hypothetical protein